MHQMISRTYDLASSQVSKQQLMREVAECFSARAAALILSGAENPPKLICCGANQALGDGQNFLWDLKADLSDAGINRLIAANFSVSLDKHDGRRYTLLLGTDSVLSDGVSPDHASAQALLSHIVRSMLVSEWSDQSIHVAEQVVDELREELEPATIIVDAACRVVHINKKATALLQSSSVIKNLHGRLEITEALMAGRLREALTTQIENADAEPHFLNLNEHEEAENLTLLLKRNDSPAREVVIYASYLRSSSLTLPEHFVERFGLTPKEVRLTVGLLQGKSLGQLADEFCVSKHTLRAQTKSVFKKADVNSQAALILLVFDEQIMVFDLRY
jgi:DNA-binding CsgD family transcriptional regulator